MCHQYFYNMLSCMRRPKGEGLDLAKKHIASSLIELDSMLGSEEFLRSSSSYRVSKDRVESITTASGCQPVGSSSAVNSARVATAAINSRFAALTRPHAVKLLHWREVRVLALLMEVFYSSICRTSSPFFVLSSPPCTPTTTTSTSCGRLSSF